MEGVVERWKENCVKNRLGITESVTEPLAEIPASSAQISLTMATMPVAETAPDLQAIPLKLTAEETDFHTGIKRPHYSDHSYIQSCDGLYGEDADADDDLTPAKDEENANNTVQKIIQLISPSITSNTTPSTTTIYDYTSILKKKSIKEITEDNIFYDIFEEMNERCPELLNSFLKVCKKDSSSLSLRHVASVVVAYCSLMFARNNKNSAFQRGLTMLAVQGGANDEFIRRLNRLSLTLSCSGKLQLLDKAAATSRQLLLKSIKENPRPKITGDNLDIYIVTNHQRTDNANNDIHWFASNITMTRLDYCHLSSDKPVVQLADIKADQFILNEMEMRMLKDVKKVIFGRILCETDHFSWLEKQIPKHIPHRYSESMSKKQDVYSLPMIFKNESKNEDCLDIMDSYETELVKIFTEAYGNLDILNSNGVVLGGDQLTRERLQNVKNIRNLANTPQGRFDHLRPIVCELWHVKQDLLSKAFKVLFKPDSFNQRGTLYHCKVILRRSDVNGNVKSNYKAHEDLFLLMVKALIIHAADGLTNENRDRDLILEKIYLKVHGFGLGSGDAVLNYFVNLMTWGLQILNMNDTAKEGDLERVVMNAKENIPFFLGHSRFSKYFTEMVNIILITEHVSSEETKMRVLEGAFINTKGGIGKNKEADLVQEHSIRNKKDLIRGLGANKTEKAVQRASNAEDAISSFSKNFDQALLIYKLSSNHTKKSSEKDLKILLDLFQTIKPFDFQEGRSFKTFSKIPKNPKNVMPQEEILRCVKQKVNRLYLNL